MNTELEYIEALAILHGGDWDWVYVAHNEASNIGHRTGGSHTPESAYITIHRGEEEIRVKIENPHGGIYNILRNLFIKDGRRILKDKSSTEKYQEYRAFKNGYKIMSHLYTRSADVTHLCEENI